MTRYYIEVSDELAERLAQVDDEVIKQVLRETADDRSDESDELAAYDSISEIRDDDSKSPEQRKRLELKAQRRDNIRNI